MRHQAIAGRWNEREMPGHLFAWQLPTRQFTRAIAGRFPRDYSSAITCQAGQLLAIGRKNNLCIPAVVLPGILQLECLRVPESQIWPELVPRYDISPVRVDCDPNHRIPIALAVRVEYRDDFARLSRHP